VCQLEIGNVLLLRVGGCRWESFATEKINIRGRWNLFENIWGRWNLFEIESSLSQPVRVCRSCKHKCIKGDKQTTFSKQCFHRSEGAEELVWTSLSRQFCREAVSQSLSRQFCLLWAISPQHNGLSCFRLFLLIWYGESWWRPLSPSPSPRPSSTSSPASSSSASSSSSSWWASPTATGAVAIGAVAAAASAVQTVWRESQKSRSTQTTSIGPFSTWRQGKRETASSRPPQDGKHPVTRLSRWHFNVSNF